MVEQWLRLARMEQDSDVKGRHQAIARDAAEVLVSNLNDQHHLSLAFESAPDTTDHHKPTPDCIYADRARDLRVAIEVTRVYHQSREQCSAQWEKLFGCVEPASRFEYVAIWETRMPPARPKQRRDAQEAVGRALEEAVSEGRESVALDSILGFPVRVGGLRKSPSAARPGVVLVVGNADLPGPLYAATLREGNGKLREWARRGYETMLVFDARFLGTFSSDSLRRFGTWHGSACMYDDKGFGDPRLDGPCPFLHTDFDSLDHVLALGLDASGVRVLSTWQSPNCRLRTPDEWCFKPDGWHDD